MNVNMKKLVCVAVALVVQCVAIGWLVWRYESIVRGGTEVRFRCEAYDPYDPLRGRYLNTTVRESCTNFVDFAAEKGKTWEFRNRLYAKLEPSTNGLWCVVAVALTPPDDGGLWVSVGNYTNTATSPALRYITPDHSDCWTYCTGRQAADNLDGCAGGGMAISNDGNTLVIANKEGVLQFYRIDWGTDRTKPQLTWLNSFTPDARDVYNATFNSGGHNSYGVYQMAFDWGGNLLVAGSNLGVYSIPTTDNQSTTPARSALTVTKVELNPTVTVTGYVYAQGHNQPSAKRRAASGTPLKDVYIVFRDGDNQEYSTTSDASGAYSIDIPAGTYDVEASKSGYYNYSATAVEINSDNSSLDITLAGIVTAIDEADVAQVSVRGAVGCIHVSATEPTHILVCDTSGRVLTQQRVEAGETTIGDLRPGIYIVNRQKVIVR